MWVQESVHRLRSAEGVFECVLEGWRGVIVSVGKDNAPDRTPCMLGSSTECLRCGNHQPMPPNKAGTFKGFGCLFWVQYLQGFLKQSPDKLPESLLLQQDSTLLWRERNVEAGEEALKRLWLQ